MDYTKPYKRSVKVINGKGDYTIKDIMNYLSRICRLNKSYIVEGFNASSSIKSRYANTTINPKYYTTISSNGKKPKELTKEEFRRGEQGIVYMDTRTGRLTFKN